MIRIHQHSSLGLDKSEIIEFDNQGPNTIPRTDQLCTNQRFIVIIRDHLCLVRKDNRVEL